MTTRIAIITASWLMAITAHSEPAHVQSRLEWEMPATTPITSLWVAAVLTMEPEWHTYWKNPGDAGLATKIQWELPPGITAGEIQWPCPDKFSDEAGTYFGYSNEVWLLTEMTLQPSVEVIRLDCTIQWLACKDLCIPGKTNLTLNLSVSSSISDKVNATDFASARDKLPTPFTNRHIKAAFTQEAINLTVTYAVAGDRLYFFPYHGSVLDHSAPQLWEQSVRETRMRLKLSPYAATVPERLEGILKINSSHAIEISVPLEQAHIQESP